MFKNFLHLKASSDAISITCFAATGCLEHENNPPIEDGVRATRTDDGRWTWANVEFTTMGELSVAGRGGRDDRTR